MDKAQYVNIQVEKHIKAAMDIFAATEYARTGKSLTNSAVIERLFEKYEPRIIEQARDARGNGGGSTRDE